MVYSRFLTVVDDERWRFEVEFWQGLAFIHATFRRKVAAMRAARELFPQLKRWLRRMGHDHCYVLVGQDDRKLYRFVRRFGFCDLCFFLGRRVMAQAC